MVCLNTVNSITIDGFNTKPYYPIEHYKVVFNANGGDGSVNALVLNNDKQKAKEYYGVELVITGGLFIVMSLFLLLYALFDSNIQDKGLTHFLLFVIPFGWVFFLLYGV